MALNIYALFPRLAYKVQARRSNDVATPYFSSQFNTPVLVRIYSASIFVAFFHFGGRFRGGQWYWHISYLRAFPWR